MADAPRMNKIRFPVSHDSVETLWATRVDVDRYKLDSIPIFVYGVSWEDIVEVVPAEGEILEYVRLIEKSGNRTVRVVFETCRNDDGPAERVLGGLRDLGCTYEGMQPRTVAVNVPPQVPLETVAEFLSDQRELQWEYADPTYEEITANLRWP